MLNSGIQHTGLLPYQDYVRRLSNLDGMNTLLRLRVAIAEKHIAAKAMPTFLSASDKSLWNPQTGKPFEWDAERKEIYLVFAPVKSFFTYYPSFDKVMAGRMGLAIP